MKETAVEYIKKKLQGYGFDFGYVLDDALEMEKEQIVNAFVECWKENMPDGYECKQSAENYYNETYKKTEQ